MKAGPERWDDLRVFLVVARAGTLGAAARELGIDASTVFRRVRSLEEQLGGRLFERRGRRWALTATGERLVEHGARIEDEVLAIARDVAGRDIELAGTITVTTADDLADRLLPRHLLAFRRQHPAIVVELLVDQRVFDLGRGEADMAIRPMRPQSGGSIVSRKICDMAGALYASVEYLERHGRPRRRADLARHDLVVGTGGLGRSAFGQVLFEHGRPERVAARANTMLTLYRAAASGLGVTALPCFLGDADEALVRLFPPEPALAGSLWLLYHGELRQTARVRAFSEFVFGSIRAERDLLEGRSR
jgi:DNA-binding transcriptional LysR family regulator